MSPKKTGTIEAELLPTRLTSYERRSFPSLHERAYLMGEKSDIDSARRTVADTYLRYGYINPEDINDSGFICETLDPHVDDSVYFGFGKSGVLAATSRLIEKNSLVEFPAIKDFGIDLKALEDLELDPQKFAEISALAKAKGVGKKEDIMHVYAQMMRYSLETGHKYWLMSADVDLARKLKKVFGKKSFTELGQPRHYMGSETVPMAMDIHSSLQLYNKYFIPKWLKEIFTENLKDLNTIHLSQNEKNILEKHGVIEDSEYKDASHKLLTPERLAMGGLVAYSLLRAAPVSTLSEYGVNAAIFLGLDLATIPPYVMGTSKLIKGKNVKDTILGASVAIGSFSAPYAYLAIEGQEMPVFPKVIIASYMSVAGLLAARRVKKAANGRNQVATEVE